jgi:hypothetical protein
MHKWYYGYTGVWRWIEMSLEWLSFITLPTHQKLLLKQYYFFVLSLIINQHCPLYLERNELNKIYLLKFLCLIEEENILHNFEKIEKNSSFQWNSSYYLQASYFGLCKSRVLAMLSWLLMLKKNQHAVRSWHSLQTRNLWTPNLELTLLHHKKAITTQDICLFSTILQNDIIDKNITN